MLPNSYVNIFLTKCVIEISGIKEQNNMEM